MKELIDLVKKPRMRTIEQYLCDQCDEVIRSSDAGFVIHGNIYVADPASTGGLIGNNFPSTTEKIDPSEIRKTVLCTTCLLKVLHINQFEKSECDKQCRGMPDRVATDHVTTDLLPPWHEDSRANRARGIRIFEESSRPHWSEELEESEESIPLDGPLSVVDDFLDAI